MRGHSLHWCLLLVLGLCCWRCQSEPIKLQVVNDWPQDHDGNPTRTDIFCSGELQGLSAPSSATAATALSNLCFNRTHYYEPEPKDVCSASSERSENSRLPYFSNSSLDAFLAGRFAGGARLVPAGQAPLYCPLGCHLTTRTEPDMQTRTLGLTPPFHCARCNVLWDRLVGAGCLRCTLVQRAEHPLAGG